MTLRTGTSPLRHDEWRFASSGREGGKKTTSSLWVRLVEGKDAASIASLGKACGCRKDSQVFIVFDETGQDAPHPVAYCCITDSIEAARGHDFKGEKRFASAALAARYPDKRFLEISIFHMLDEKKAHRAKGLLWRAIADYCQGRHIDYVLGCFSFDGKYPAAYALEFSYLYHYCQADPQLQMLARTGVSMDIMPAEAVRPDQAFRFLPPLLRYCLRLGAKVSNRVVVDKNTDALNIFLLMPARTICAPAF